MTSRASFFKYSLAFAAIAALMELQPICVRTFSLFFSREAPLAYYTSIGNFAPVPRALLWSSLVEGITIRLGTLSAAATLSYELILWLCAAYMVLRILNPTFRLTTGVDWDSELLTRTYMHTAPLIKAFLIAMAATVPAFLILAGIQAVLGDGPLSLSLRLALVGAAAWLFFSRKGVAGDYESGNYELPRRRSETIDLVIRGAVAGLMTAWTFSQAGKLDAEQLFGFLSTLGGIGEGGWRVIVLVVCGTAAWMGVGVALMVIGLGAEVVEFKRRIGITALAAAFLGTGGVFTGWLLPNHLRERYDYKPMGRSMDARVRAEPARDLAAKAHVRTASTETDTVIMIRPNRGIALNILRASAAGLSADPTSSKKIEEFLQRRGFETSLADAAFMTMHDAASLQWDSVESLRVDYLRLTNCPDARFMKALNEKLQDSPAVPECARYADLLADESRFYFETRDSMMNMGDIFARFGQKEKAKSWYRRAHVPPGRIDEILPARTMFANGEILGRVVMNGKPAVGMRVGTVPARVMQQITYNRIGSGTILPYWLRWVGSHAVTDQDGRFSIRNIVAGNYRLILSDPNLKLEPFSNRLSVEGGPGEMFVGFGKPMTDVGEIKLTVQGPDQPSPLRLPTT